MLLVFLMSGSFDGGLATRLLRSNSAAVCLPRMPTRNVGMSNAGKQATCDHLVAGYQGGIVRGYQRIGCACADLTGC